MIFINKVEKNERKEDNEDNENENESLDLVGAQGLLDAANTTLDQIKIQLNTLEIVFFNNYLNDLTIRNDFLAMYYKLQYGENLTCRFKIDCLYIFDIFPIFLIYLVRLWSPLCT